MFTDIGPDFVTSNRRFIYAQLVTEAMPRLSPVEHKGIIGRLEAGEPRAVIANAFRVHLYTIYRLQARF